MNDRGYFNEALEITNTIYQILRDEIIFSSLKRRRIIFRALPLLDIILQTHYESVVNDNDDLREDCGKRKQATGCDFFVAGNTDIHGSMPSPHDRLWGTLQSPFPPFL